MRALARMRFKTRPEGRTTNPKRFVVRALARMNDADTPNSRAKPRVTHLAVLGAIPPLWHNAAMDYAGYEESLGPAARWAKRAGRRMRWWGKSLVGAPRTILVETRWRLGDEIMMLPVFDALRVKYPAARIAVLTNYPDLFRNHPFVDSVNAVPDSVDRYVLLRGAARDRLRIAVYARRAGVDIPGTRPHLYYPDWNPPLLAELPPGEAPLVALAPHTTWPTKHWLPERWHALAEALQARGCRVIELGTEHALGLGTPLVGRTSVYEAACVLHACHALVSVDNGLMHLALASGSAAVGLFGPTDPGILIQDDQNFYPICSAHACAGYWNRPGPTPNPEACPVGHPCCLDGITVDHVLAVLRKRVTWPRDGES